jgi:hypothetical protein
MLTEEIEIILDTINITRKTLSAAKHNVVKKDGIEIARNLIDRMAFVPGDILKATEYLGAGYENEIAYLNSVWTPEVIAAHEALVAAAQQEDL